MTTRRFRGVTIRNIKNKTATSYQVRWRERIDGKTKDRTKNFSDSILANKFSTSVRVRLGVVKEKPLGMMADVLRSDGDMEKTIAEYVADVSLSSKESSDYPEQEKGHLIRGMRRFSWKHTSDLCADNLKTLIADCKKKNTNAFQALSCYKRFIKWCAPRYKVETSCLLVKTRRPVSDERVYWTPEQVEKILMAMHASPSSDRNYVNEEFATEWAQKLSTKIHQRTWDAFLLLFKILVLYALRPGEASRLHVKDWDSHKKVLRVTHKSAKNGDPRFIPVEPDTGELLDAVCKGRSPHEIMLLTAHGSPWEVGHMSTTFKRLLKKLEIPGSLYCARHYACSQLLRKYGMERMRMVMRYTGHKTPSEFMKYIHAWSKEYYDIATGDYADHINGIFKNAKQSRITPSETTALKFPPSSSVQIEDVSLKSK